MGVFHDMKSRQSFKSNNNGQAILELALVLPVLLLMLVGVVDLGRATSEYSKNVTIARDVVNLAGRLGGLENGSCTSTGPAETCSTQNLPTHLFLFNRARTLASLRELPWVNWDSMDLVSNYNATNRTVTFTMTVSFQTMLNGSFGAIPLKVSVTGPYMLGSGRQSGVNPPKSAETEVADKYGTDQATDYTSGADGSEMLVSGLYSGRSGSEVSAPSSGEKMAPKDPLLFAPD